MSKSSLRHFIIAGVVGSAAFHILLMYFEWYLVYESIDKMQHFFGGVVVAAFILYWIIERHSFLLQGPWYIRLAVVVSFSLLLGIGWEIFEYSFDRLWGPWIAPYAALAQPSLHDTMRDIIADLGGSILGALLFWRLLSPTVIRNFKATR